MLNVHTPWIRPVIDIAQEQIVVNDQVVAIHNVYKPGILIFKRISLYCQV